MSQFDGLDYYPNGEGSLQRAFNRFNDIDPDNGGLDRIMAYTIIVPDEQYDADTDAIREKVQGKNFVSVCMKLLNNVATSCYEIALVKVEDFKITKKFESYIQTIKPVSKALRKIVPDELMAKIESAPTFKDLWQEIEPMLDSSVLVGASGSESRFVYCCNNYELPLPVMAYVGFRGSEPANLKLIHDKGLEEDTRSAMDYATEWAENMIEDRTMNA